MNITNDTLVEPSLVDQHKAFKDNAVRVLHRVGDQQRLCTDFDSILVDAGLPGRDTFYDDNTERDRPELVGEGTAEEFENWKRGVARTLHEAAVRLGIDGGEVDNVMIEIGLPTRDAFYRTVNPKVEGTFSLSMGRREVAISDDVIDNVGRHDIADALYRGVNDHSSDITWKVVVDA